LRGWEALLHGLDRASHSCIFLTASARAFKAVRFLVGAVIGPTAGTLWKALDRSRTSAPLNACAEHARSFFQSAGFPKAARTDWMGVPGFIGHPFRCLVSKFFSNASMMAAVKWLSTHSPDGVSEARGIALDLARHMSLKLDERADSHQTLRNLFLPMCLYRPILRRPSTG